jgi:hypothetical protein
MNHRKTLAGVLVALLTLAPAGVAAAAPAAQPKAAVGITAPATYGSIPVTCRLANPHSARAQRNCASAMKRRQIDRLARHRAMQDSRPFLTAYRAWYRYYAWILR